LAAIFARPRHETRRLPKIVRQAAEPEQAVIFHPGVRTTAGNTPRLSVGLRLRVTMFAARPGVLAAVSAETAAIS